MPVQPPTLRDVAEAAGVHAGTASRALNPATRGLVNAETARRVIKVAESLGYRPNPIARGLKTSKSQTVGLVIPDLTNPLFPPIVRGHRGRPRARRLQRPDRQHRQRPPARARADRVPALAPGRRTHRRDGPPRPPTARAAAPLRACRWCWSTVGRRASASPSVTPDDAAGVRLAVEHLAALGHRRIVHLAGPQTTSTGVAASQRLPQRRSRPRARRRSRRSS